MKRYVLTLAVVVLAFGVAAGQEQPGPNYEHLKPHSITIGTWRYEGPLLEDVPGYAAKGSKFVDQCSWRWILNRNAIEVSWRYKFEGGKTMTGRGLVGWNAAEKKIVFGGMDSVGNMNVGIIDFGDDGKTTSLTAQGTDAKGEKTSFKNVLTITGDGTFTIQTTERTGGSASGPGPVYTYKRVEREGERKRERRD